MLSVNEKEQDNNHMGKLNRNWGKEIETEGNEKKALLKGIKGGMIARENTNKIPIKKKKHWKQEISIYRQDRGEG